MFVDFYFCNFSIYIFCPLQLVEHVRLIMMLLYFPAVSGNSHEDVLLVPHSCLLISRIVYFLPICLNIQIEKICIGHCDHSASDPNTSLDNLNAL